MKIELFYSCGRFLRVLYQRFFDDGCMSRAASLTYTTLLSIVPLITVSFAIFSAFPVFNTISMQIQTFIFSHFIAASGAVIQDYIQKFVLQTKNLSAIGASFLVLSAILMMFNMEQAFNAIWKVKSRGKSVATFLLYWAVLTLSPILIGLSIIVSSYISKLAFVTSTADHIGIIVALPFLLNMIFFTLLYVLVPNCYVPIRYGCIGALVATVLFNSAKWCFAYYVTHFPTYILLYGALATIPLFLVWLYLMWTIILFGAIISNLLATGYHFRSHTKIDGFTHAFLWIGYLYHAMQNGISLSMQELISMDTCGYVVEPAKQIELLVENKLICKTKPGRFVLSSDLHQLSLAEFSDKLPWRYPTSKELLLCDNHLIHKLKKVVEESEKYISPKRIIPA